MQSLSHAKTIHKEIFEEKGSTPPKHNIPLSKCTIRYYQSKRIIVLHFLTKSSFEK